MRVEQPNEVQESLWSDIRIDGNGTDEMTIAIVGGGFTGICVAAHLHRAARQPLRIVVFERKDVGTGIAHGTRESAHFLNGPASNHSPFDDYPDEFANFLAGEPEAQCFLDLNKPIGGQFVPRMLYGRYLKHLSASLTRPSPTGATVTFVKANVDEIAKRSDHVEIVSEGRTLLRAESAVLAVGHPPPRSLATRVAAGHLVDDPWDAGAIHAIPPDASVVLVGTGQTAVDIALGMIANGHRGAITLLSRRGLIAVPFISVERPYLLDPKRIPQRLLPFIRWLRSESERFTQEGGNWRGVINSLRPYSQQIWSGFSAHEKRRFFEHMAPFWYMHRSRLPPQSARRLGELRAEGRVAVAAGRIVGVTSNDIGAVLQVRPRGEHRIIEMPATTIVNCTGPWWDLQKPQNPLVAALLASGMIRWDDIGQGIAVSMEGVPFDANGRPAERLFAVGPICRGTLLESMVVRDIRTQCAALADRLLAKERIGVVAA
ncbi:MULTISPECIES: FAD/NAD(P)-binding protein [unclassified Bradyrhizobium]|uniref:FAD/NAD(P)-binding protein n=1 Tax=unclassified Bradyrhizobium TaxID=2631580 RepID=UPI002916CDB1|nr:MULTISPECIES: FAD/NAD(P)-binding protein [unclassified Bradyrhizobium]